MSSDYRALQLCNVLACAVILALLLTSIPIPAVGQQTETSGELHLGIIVTRTAEQADSVLKKLNAGWDFGVLAREYSIDPSAARGGYLGRLRPDQLRSELRDALNGVKAGQFSSIVSTSTGFAILTVFASEPAWLAVERRLADSLHEIGSVPAGLDLSGISQADALFRAAQKPENWSRDLSEICEIRKGSYAAGVAGLQARVAAATKPDSGNTRLDLLRAQIALGQLYTYMGEMPQAIQQFEAALTVAQAGFPDGVPILEETLGDAWLQQAEMENGAFHGKGDLDIFPPLHPGAHFDKPEGSQHAVEYLSKYLATKPDNDQAKWLLNLAYFTLGKYPDGVPPALLIPPAAFASGQDIGRFKDIAHATGLDAFFAAGGLVVDDFENNGLLDVVITSQDVCEPMRYFHNNGDGTFSDRSAQAGLSDQLGGLNIVAADYNNDGCIDLLVLRGGWEFGMRKSLLRNNCNGTFTDVTDASGLGRTVTQTQSAVWADIDNDGNLDLFIANENTPAQLFRNRGDGTFEDISHAAGVDRSAYSKAVAAADYDNDGFIDFYVSNFNGANFLYRNNGDRTFTEIAAQAGVREPLFSFSSWFFDYDNDGWPDLLVTDYPWSVDDEMRSYLHQPARSETMKLYRNMHNGTFEDVTSQVGLDRVFMPMGTNFGDVDNDGFLDIYLGMGNPSLGSLTPHELLRNENGKRFVDITASSGTGELHKGHGIAFADLRHDGLLDIISENGGAIPAEKHVLRLFQNPGNRNDWTNVHLVGIKSNRIAIGAKIQVTVQNAASAPRSIWRTVGETSSFGGNPTEQHIGLGPDAKIVSLDVFWPASGTHQHFAQVDKNTFIQIKEFDSSITKLIRKPVRMGENHVADRAIPAD
ncbi:MAG TPA: FG-GAP-like repeat-containing protein [Terracidiphilus sp.]|nr:FG-GAP-like repeat-containing protein [Terracidiphilus sp.]